MSLILIYDIYDAIQGLEEAQLKYKLINSVSFFFWKKTCFFPVLGKYHDENIIIKCNENLKVRRNHYDKNTTKQQKDRRNFRLI